MPFEEFQGKYVSNPMSGEIEPMSGEIEPMSGPLTGTVVEESKTMMSPDVETIFVIDRREGSGTFGMEIPGDGIIFDNGLYVTLPANTSITVFIQLGGR